MSVVTPGGHETARALVGKGVTAAFYAPFDVPIAVRRTLRAVRPAVLVLMETELWPNLLYLARQSGARVMTVNGRISDRSIGRYRRAAGLFGWVLGNVERILVQTPRDRDRFAQIGADPGRVEVVGNSKFDQAPERLDAAGVERLKDDLGLATGAPVMVVGSTRTAAEERIVLEAYSALLRDIPSLAIVHAPRHVERAGEVADAMRRAGLRPVRRTEERPGGERVQQLVLDTFGELAGVYAVADIAFIGNSLTPPGGGQNLLQALAHGKPVLFGPYMQNFRDLAEMARSDGVGFTVTDAATLATAARELLMDAPRRARIAESAIALVERNRGAARRYAEEIARRLPPAASQA